MTDTEHPLPDLHELAAARRSELAAGWPTAAQAGIAMGIEGEDASQFVTRLRKRGAFLGVYMTESTHHSRFPAWQFDAEHRPIQRFSKILEILHDYGNYLDDQGRTTGWGEVEWFLSAHVLLDDRAPCEVLQEDPDAVLEAARVEYIDNPPTG